MHINYLEDDDLAFLPECSEAHLEAFTRILTHGENGKPRLSSTLLRNETFLAMEGHPERYRRRSSSSCWRIFCSTAGIN